MGLFNWVFKGVKVDHRVPKTRAAEAVLDLDKASEPVSADTQQAIAAGAQVQPQVQASAQPQADLSNILFENAQGQQSFVNSGAVNSYQNQFSSALGGATYGNRNILVVTPRSNAEVTEVVANLQHGDACIICLEGLVTEDAQRRLDFLSGVICAMNGSIKRLNANTYILTPNGLGVRN